MPEPEEMPIQRPPTYLVLHCTALYSALNAPRPAVRRVLLLLYSIFSRPAADSSLPGTRFVLALSRGLQRVASCYRQSGSVCVCGGENPTRPAKIFLVTALIRPFVAGPVDFQIACDRARRLATAIGSARNIASQSIRQLSLS
jgi:hypothetical protein